MALFRSSGADPVPMQVAKDFRAQVKVFRDYMSCAEACSQANPDASWALVTWCGVDVNVHRLHVHVFRHVFFCKRECGCVRVSVWCGD